jgi:hypothetical protein
MHSLPGRSTAGTWLRHVLFGIPLGAGLHTAVQTAADWTPHDGGALLTLAHFTLGMLCGGVVLGPAFSVQALVSVGLARAGAGRAMQVAAGGFVQAGCVGLWALLVGIEPSLPGRFPRTLPMIGAGFIAGAAVAAFAAHPRSAVEDRRG